MKLNRHKKDLCARASSPHSTTSGVQRQMTWGIAALADAKVHRMHILSSASLKSNFMFSRHVFLNM